MKLIALYIVVAPMVILAGTGPAARPYLQVVPR